MKPLTRPSLNGAEVVLSELSYFYFSNRETIIMRRIAITPRLFIGKKQIM